MKPEFTYDEFNALMERAWYEFFTVLSAEEIDAEAVEKEIFYRNDTADMVKAAVKKTIQLIEE